MWLLFPYCSNCGSVDVAVWLNRIGALVAVAADAASVFGIDRFAASDRDSGCGFSFRLFGTGLWLRPAASACCLLLLLLLV